MKARNSARGCLIFEAPPVVTTSGASNILFSQIQFQNSKTTARPVCCLHKMTDGVLIIKTTAHPISCFQKTTGGGEDQARYQKTTGGVGTQRDIVWCCTVTYQLAREGGEPQPRRMSPLSFLWKISENMEHHWRGRLALSQLYTHLL